MGDNGNTTWNWERERAYIDGLGSWSLLLLDRTTLLQNYLKAMDLRDPQPEWHRLAQEYVRRALKNEKARRKP